MLGLRIRAARHAAGLTQHQVAHPGATAAYLSRIESGQRRPSDRLLRQIAERVGVPTEDLLSQSAQEPEAELLLRVSRAEWQHHQGRPEQAQVLAARTAVEAAAAGWVDLAARTRTIEARAALAAGHPESAARILEDVLARNPNVASSIRAHALLASALSSLGDDERAAQVAARGRRVADRAGAFGLPEDLELALAQARALAALGGIRTARRICVEALRRRRITVSTDTAQAAERLREAYWEASVAEAAHGSYGSAWRHAESALALTEVRALAASAAALTQLASSLGAPDPES